MGAGMTAIYGTFASIKTMADGTPRITLDLGCSLAEVAALGLMPGAAFGLARITGESTIAPVAEQKPVEKIGPLCRLACQFCQSPDFQDWVSSFEYECINEELAKHFILTTCGIDSRKELDTDKQAEATFHSEIRLPYMKWLGKQRVVV